MGTTHARSFTRLAIAVVIAAIVISASVLSYASLEATVTKTITPTQASTSTVTATVTSPTTIISTTTVTQLTTVTSTATVTSPTASSTSVVFLLNVNGSYYWADDVSTNIVIGSPGYSYFLNGSITFDGVTFQMICPSNYDGCPGSNASSSTMVWADAVQLKMTFPSGTNETDGYAGFFTPTPTYIFSQNSTLRAGMLVEYVLDYNYPHSTVPYAVFLLVSSCGAPPHLC